MTMTSSTEALSAGSVHDYNASDDSRLAKSPRRPKYHSPVKSKKASLSDELQDEINELLDNVPDLGTTFTILDKIGAGTFSSVYLARLKNHPQVETMFALKHIIPTSHPFRIENELRCLQEIGGSDNVMGVEACLRARDHVVIIMPYFAHDYFPDYIKTVTVSEVRDYMRALLVSLRHVHADDIIHRDIKPTNFLVNKELKKYALVDFGLAQKAPVLLKQKSGNAGSRFTLANIPTGSRLPPTPSVTISKPISPRKLHRQTEAATRTSPRKRKLQQGDAENFPESPRKRKVTEDPEAALTEVDLNATKNTDKKAAALNEPGNNHNDKNTDDTKDNRKSLTPTSLEMFHNKNKSPRRMLLTKRALDLTRRETINMKGPMRTVVVQQAGRSMYKTMSQTACQCLRQPMVCNICVSRSPQVAPRAGTPGFRAPEVLMKCPDQTTAVDIWAAGVIFLSLLSGRYPFFKADDDMTALAQITSILGAETMKKASRAYGKEFLCNPCLPGVDMRMMCERLRSTTTAAAEARKPTRSSLGEKSWASVPDSAYDLLLQLLNPNPNTRITAGAALSHPFMKAS